MPLGGSVFKGTIDELSIYNRALSLTEITSLYLSGTGGKCKTTSITVQPVSQTATEGSSVTFTVTAIGTGPLSYQWMLNGQDIAGATSPAFTVGQVQTSDSGRVYAVRITGPAGTVTSAAAALTVQPCDPAARPLTVNAWKRGPDDKFYFEVRNLAGFDLAGGRFDLFAYFDGVNRTLVKRFQPWVETDVLHNGDTHMFTFCSADHSITNLDCAIVYQGGGQCAASQKFRIAASQDLALLIENTTLISNPCKECNNCQPGDEGFISPQPRPDNGYGTYCGTGLWPQPLSGSLNGNGGSALLDNFYKASNPPKQVDLTAPKQGFKNVYAIKQWHGAFGPKAGVHRGFQGANGNGGCKISITKPPLDTTKYLDLQAVGNCWSQGSYRGIPYPRLEGTASSTCSVSRFSGRTTESTSETGDSGDARDAIDIAAKANLGNIIDYYSGALPPGGTIDVPGQGSHPVTYSGFGSSIQCSWNFQWDWTDEGSIDCADVIVRHYGHDIGTITCDLLSGSVTYHHNVFSGLYSFDGCRDQESDLQPNDIYDWSLQLSDAGAQYSYDHTYTDNSGNDSSAHHDATITYGEPYTSDQVNQDCDALLAQWNLLDDVQYPWRNDGAITTGPLVTYNELGATAPIVVSGDPPPKPLPWPSQPEGAVLGAPLEVHGPNGELYTHEPYFNFYHINWGFEETDRGHPQGFIQSYGAASPFPNATQWVDADQARVFPGGPFWAYGSSVEGSDHLMFRLKSPYITDTDGEYEEGGYGAGCLIKCKWAETLDSAAAPGMDFVFKDWDFDFRRFIESYRCAAAARSWNTHELTCPAMAECAPIGFTPITSPPDDPVHNYYIGPGSWWVSGMNCQPIHYDYDCCQPAVYVQPNSPGTDCANGVVILMPPAVCDDQYGSLWMGRVDQSTGDSQACAN